MKSIGIYKSVDREVGFFDGNAISVVNRLLDGAAKLLDCDLIDAPDETMKAQKIGEVILKSVEDDATYEIEVPEPVGKPDVNRKPTGEAGTWMIQSLIFSKENFADEAACKTWISEHEGFGNYGAEETDTSFRFRQYDPQHFDQFRNISITEGVSAVYGKIKAEASDDDAEKAERELEKAIEIFEAVHAVNKGIMANGIKLLSKTAEVRKADDGGEERYILGLVLEPTDGTDGSPFKPDTQNDVYSAKTIRDTAHGWMENYGHIDLHHSWEPLSKGDVRILETYLAPVDFEVGGYNVIKGTWLLALRVLDDEIWKKTETELGAFSIAGSALREPIETPSE
ncbi:MAG: XkdF-like putative serine protease domain-containing protein [Acidimicrobiia bacterium]